MPSPALPALEFAPWRLSGLVCGALLNDPAQLAALGEAVHAPPYKAPPRAPVLYLKPRNTLATDGAATEVPAEAGKLVIGATLGMVIGRAACRVPAERAMDFIAGWVLVADLFVPHVSFYRPSVRQRARDASCVIGPVLPRDALARPDALELRLSVNGRLVQRANTAAMSRPVARLLQDVSAFMTLAPGDLLLLGVSHGAPQAGAGDRYELAAPGLSQLRGELVAETVPVAVDP